MLTKLTIFRNNKNFNVCFEHFWHTVFEAFCILFGEGGGPKRSFVKIWCNFRRRGSEEFVLFLLLMANCFTCCCTWYSMLLLLHITTVTLFCIFRKELYPDLRIHLLRVGMFVIVRVLEFQFIHLHFDKIAAPLSFQTS